MKKFFPSTFQGWFEVFFIGSICLGCLFVVFTFILDNQFLSSHAGKNIAQSYSSSADTQVFLLQDKSTIAIKNSVRTVQYDLDGKKFENIALSPSNTYVILVTREVKAQETQPPQFSVFNLDTKKLTLLPIGGNNPTFLDDDTIAYDINGKIHIAKLSDPENVTRLVAGTHPSAIVGKNTFVYQTPQHQLAIFRIETLESVLLPIEFNAFSPAVSPNGELIAFLTATESVPCGPFCHRDMWVYEVLTRKYWPISTSGNTSHPRWFNNQGVVAKSDFQLKFASPQLVPPMYEFNVKGTDAPKIFQMYP
ncbi:MAG: hypothetical protein AAB508_03200 [Patescibacteria group bacterium]